VIESVQAALRNVFDPELDESLVDLGFIDSLSVSDGRVDLTLRLPTFWCAPNFAYLMVSDAREAVEAVPGVREAHVSLKDHMYSEELSHGGSFVETFGEQAEGEDLQQLRSLFNRKAFGMRQEQLVRFLQEVGLSAVEIVALRLEAPLPRGAAPLLAQYLERRARLGISSDALITDTSGRPIAAEDLDAHLRETRRQRISMTFNALTCRGLLETRYELATKGAGA
jgi:metal-sulfur cluster biosynthetic enzyme